MREHLATQVDTRVSPFPPMTLGQVAAMVPDLNARDTVRQAYKGQTMTWCKLMWTYIMVEEMSDVVALIHAPLNCSACMKQQRGTTNYDFGNPHLHTPTTNIGRDQVIFGGEVQLYEAILAVDRDYRPELILVLTGCAAALTLDDIQAVAKRAQQKTKAKVFPVPSAGFDYMGNGFFEDVLPLFADLMEPPVQVHQDWVNILGNNKQPYCGARYDDVGYVRHQDFPSDAEEMGRLIERMGLRVHVVFSSDPYRRFRHAPEGAINTFACASHGLPLARAMQERFETPYVNLSQPLGPISTARWIRLLGEATGKKAEGEHVINREWSELREIWHECENMVKGKTALVVGIANRPLSVGRMCQELGMDVVMTIRPQHLRARGTAEHWLETGFNPMCIVRDESPAGAKLAETMEWLGLAEDDVVYLYAHHEVPYARAGIVDPANVPWVNLNIWTGRHKGYPSRGGGLGYRGAKGLCIKIMEAIRAARRKDGWSFLGRLQEGEGIE